MKRFGRSRTGENDTNKLIDDDDERSDEPEGGSSDFIATATQARVAHNLTERVVKYRALEGEDPLTSITSMSDIGPRGAVFAVGGRGGFGVVNAEAKSLKGPSLYSDVKRLPGSNTTSAYHSVSMATAPSSGTSLLVVWLTSASATQYQLTGTSEDKTKRDKADEAVQKTVRVFAFSTPSSGKAPSLGRGSELSVKPSKGSGKTTKIYHVCVSPTANKYAIAFLARQNKFQAASQGAPIESDVHVTQYSPNLGPGGSLVSAGSGSELSVPNFVRELDSARLCYSNADRYLVLAANQGVRMNNKRELFVYFLIKGEDESTKQYARRVNVEHEVTCMDFNADDSLLAVGMLAGHRVELVSTKDWELKQSIALEAKAVWSIAFTHPVLTPGQEKSERQYFACMGTTSSSKPGQGPNEGAAAYICDFERKETLAKLHELPTPEGLQHTKLGKVCSFTKDGHLITANEKGELVKYDLTTDRQERGGFKSKASKLPACAVSGPTEKGSRWIAYAYPFSNEKKKQVWRLTLKLIPAKYVRGSNNEWPDTESHNFDYEAAQEIKRLVFSPDGRSLAIAWSVPGPPSSEDKKPTRRSLVHLRALPEPRDGGREKWDVVLKAADDFERVDGDVQDLKFAPRGKTLVLASDVALAVYNVDQEVYDTVTLILKRARPSTWISRPPRMGDVSILKKTEVYDELKQLVRTGRLDLGIDDVTALAASNRGHIIVAGGEKVVTFIDVEQKEAIGRVVVPGEMVTALAFSNDDRLLAVGGHAGGVNIIDVMTQTIVKQCGKREYTPKFLVFSPDGAMLLDSTATTKQGSDEKIDHRGTLYSVDGAEQALVNPIDLSAMLAAKLDGGKRAFDPERANNLAELVQDNPGQAYAILPRKEINESTSIAAQAARRQSGTRRGSTGGFTFGSTRRQADKEYGQWLKDDVASKLRDAGVEEPNAKCRMIDVLVAQRERLACEAVLEHVPALPLVPLLVNRLGRRSTPFLPSFTIAARVRGHHVLKALLHASARAPVSLRPIVAERVLPFLVSEGMGNTVSDFFAELELEPSSAAISYAVDKAGRPLTKDETLILWPTWGGEGSLVWLEYDPDPTKIRQARELHDRGSGANEAASVRIAEEKVIAPAYVGKYEDQYVAFVSGVRDIRKNIVLAVEWLLEKWTSFVNWWRENVRLAMFAYLIKLGLYYIYTGFHTCISKGSKHLPDREVGGVTLPPFMRGSRKYVATWAEDNEPIEPKQPEPRDFDEERAGKAEVTAMRVGLPNLSSKHFLYMIRDMPEGSFDNAAIGKTVRALWTNHFFALHVIKALLVFLTSGAYLYFVVQLHAGHRSSKSNADFLAESNEQGEMMSTMGNVILFTLVITFINSFLQLYGAIEAYDDLLEGLISGTIEYITNPWNIFDLLLVWSLGWAVYGEMNDVLPLFDVNEGEHTNVAGLLALSGLFLLVRVIQVLRGFELTGWLIMALIQNIRDMTGFIVVLGLIIVFFAGSFLTLFPFQASADEAARRALAEIVASGNHTAVEELAPALAAALEKEPEGFATFSEALLVTFNMGFFGDFDTDQFEASINPAIFRLLFVFFMIIVGVVALNALIALLGDSYAHVQEQRAEQTLRLYATCIVEYYNTMGPLLRRMREKSLAWTHALRVGSDDNEDMPREWAGQLTIIKREIHDKTADLKENISAIDTKVTELVKTVGAIDKKVNEEKLAREEAQRQAKLAAERKKKEEEEERLRRAYVNSRNDVASVADMSDVANLSDLDDEDKE